MYPTHVGFIDFFSHFPDKYPVGSRIKLHGAGRNYFHYELFVPLYEFCYAYHDKPLFVGYTTGQDKSKITWIS
jgi:hypothetical protein